MGVYRITNIHTGFSYVGSSCNVKNRWYQHRFLLKNGTHPSKPLLNAWLQFGQDSFEFAVLELIAEKHLLRDAEQRYLDDLKTYNSNFGFNSYKNSRGPSVGELNDETRVKMSTSHKGKKIGPQSEAHRLAISKAKKGKKATLEQRAKMSASRKGKKRGTQSESHKQALSAVRKGRKMRPETCEAMRVAHKGKPLTGTHLENVRKMLVERNKSNSQKEASVRNIMAYNQSR